MYKSGNQINVPSIWMNLGEPLCILIRYKAMGTPKETIICINLPYIKPCFNQFILVKLRLL